MTDMTLAEAIEVFVAGFSFTRSFTFPYYAEFFHERVWVLRDAPRTRGDYRTEEFVGHGLEPATLDAIAKEHTRGHYRLCVLRAVEESDAPLRTGFKALGYRLMGTEAFMVHRLAQIQSVPEPVSIVRVTTREMAEALAKAAVRRQILPEHLEAQPAPMRQYAALDGEKFVGWVGSVSAVCCAWCTNMFVTPVYRRRGIARALLTRMLQEDRPASTRAGCAGSCRRQGPLDPGDAGPARAPSTARAAQSPLRAGSAVASARRVHPADRAQPEDALAHRSPVLAGHRVSGACSPASASQPAHSVPRLPMRALGARLPQRGPTLSGGAGQRLSWFGLRTAPISARLADTVARNLARPPRAESWDGPARDYFLITNDRLVAVGLCQKQREPTADRQ